MFEIIWLESAISDLTRLRLYLAEVNPHAAHRMARIIIDATVKLKEFPLVGRLVEDLEDFYDLFIEFGSSGYNLRYKLFNKKIYIIHIKHAKELGFYSK
jgi:plasmid stabilization system protein ParE